ALHSALIDFTADFLESAGNLRVSDQDVVANNRRCFVGWKEATIIIKSIQPIGLDPPVCGVSCSQIQFALSDSRIDKIGVNVLHLAEAHAISLDQARVAVMTLGKFSGQSDS